MNILIQCDDGYETPLLTTPEATFQLLFDQVCALRKSLDHTFVKPEDYAMYLDNGDPSSLPTILLPQLSLTSISFATDIKIKILGFLSVKKSNVLQELTSFSANISILQTAISEIVKSYEITMTQPIANGTINRYQDHSVLIINEIKIFLHDIAKHYDHAIHDKSVDTNLHESLLDSKNALLSGDWKRAISILEFPAIHRTIKTGEISTSMQAGARHVNLPNRVHNKVPFGTPQPLISSLVPDANQFASPYGNPLSNLKPPMFQSGQKQPSLAPFNPPNTNTKQSKPTPSSSKQNDHVTQQSSQQIQNQTTPQPASVIVSPPAIEPHTDNKIARKPSIPKNQVPATEPKPTKAIPKVPEPLPMEIEKEVVKEVKETKEIISEQDTQLMEIEENNSLEPLVPLTQLSQPTQPSQPSQPEPSDNNIINIPINRLKESSDSESEDSDSDDESSSDESSSSEEEEDDEEEEEEEESKSIRTTSSDKLKNVPLISANTIPTQSMISDESDEESSSGSEDESDESSSGEEESSSEEDDEVPIKPSSSHNNSTNKPIVHPAVDSQATEVSPGDIEQTVLITQQEQHSESEESGSESDSEESESEEDSSSEEEEEEEKTQEIKVTQPEVEESSSSSESEESSSSEESESSDDESVDLMQLQSSQPTPHINRTLSVKAPSALKNLLIKPPAYKSPSHFLPVHLRSVPNSQEAMNENDDDESSSSSSSSSDDSDSDDESSSSEEEEEEEVKIIEKPLVTIKDLKSPEPTKRSASKLTKALPPREASLISDTKTPYVQRSNGKGKSTKLPSKQTPLPPKESLRTLINNAANDDIIDVHPLTQSSETNKTNPINNNNTNNTNNTNNNNSTSANGKRKYTRQSTSQTKKPKI